MKHLENIITQKFLTIKKMNTLGLNETREEGLVRMAIILAATTLVDAGFLGDFGPDQISIYFSNLCQLTEWGEYCNIIQSTDPNAYTHLILFMIMLLRINVITRKDNKVMFENMWAPFIHEWIIFMYAMLLARLAYRLILNLPDRYTTEGLMFITIVSFYYDFHRFKIEAPRNTATIETHYDNLHGQIQIHYLKSDYFTTNSVAEKVNEYIDKDEIKEVYFCIAEKFLREYEDKIGQLDVIKLNNMYGCLLRRNDRPNMWIRYLRYYIPPFRPTFPRHHFQGAKYDLIRNVGSRFNRSADTIQRAVDTYKRASNRALRFGKALHFPTFPIITRPQQVIAEFVGFTSSVAQDALVAFVYSFFRKDVMKRLGRTTSGNLIWKMPDKPAYLVRIRNDRGVSTTVRYYRTPEVETENTSTSQTGGQNQQDVLDDLIASINRGYIAEAVPMEIEAYINSKISDDQEFSAFTDYQLTDIPNAQQQIISSLPADDPNSYAQFVEKDNTIHFVMPETPLVKEALLNVNLAPSSMEVPTTSGQLQLEIGPFKSR